MKRRYQFSAISHFHNSACVSTNDYSKKFMFKSKLKLQRLAKRCDILNIFVVFDVSTFSNYTGYVIVYHNFV